MLALPKKLQKVDLHVGAFSYVSDTGPNEGLSLLFVELVLRSRRKGDVGLADKGPGPLALVPLEFGASGEGSQALSLKLDVGNLHNLFSSEALITSGDEGTSRIGERKDGTTELKNLESSVLSNVTGTGNKDSLASPVGVVEVTEHFSNVVDETVTREGQLAASHLNTRKPTQWPRDGCEILPSRHPYR